MDAVEEAEGRLPRPAMSKRDWNNVKSTARWAKWKEAELRPDAGRIPRSPISERESGSGRTWGALRRDSMERGGVTAFQGSLTQTRRNDMRGAACWAQWKEAELRPSAGRLPRSPNFGTRSESGRTWGDLPGTTALRGRLLGFATSE